MTDWLNIPGLKIDDLIARRRHVSEPPEYWVLLKIHCQWSFTEVCSKLKDTYIPKILSQRKFHSIVKQQ